MESILRKAWNLPKGFDVIKINGNTFMFNFVKEEEYNRVLRGRPWSINGFLLNLMERSKYKTYEEFDFSRGPMWIQMHNVPMEALCLENTVTIGGYVGEVMLAENLIYNGKYVHGCMRAKVLLDLKNPLAYGFWMDRPDGEKAWIPIRYEKLQNFCYKCGKIGHDNRNCKYEQLMSAFDPSEPWYGAWLTTNMSRNRDDITEIVQSDWSESRYVQKKKEEALRRKREEDVQKATMSSNLQEEELFVIKMHKNLKEIKGISQRNDKEATDANRWKTKEIEKSGGRASSSRHDNGSVDAKEKKKEVPRNEEVIEGKASTMSVEKELQ
ncbi:hypothetical protein K1719_039629 [Acacia pycnantha]|nr:hypothetical protein K1719_039629 [Acacia pycnantha]